ncbi:twin-arginine translocation signal domain-containing protein [Thalassoglobus sp.]|uniref:twin-arginine translocation signal domain-containing protein n=1 Tax=Thalassoglobus sp. TaxID=2795869 RepID=UPI003AA95125
MTDDESKVSRREFIKFAAFTSASAGGLYALTAKSDILAEEPLLANRSDEEAELHGYTYAGGVP